MICSLSAAALARDVELLVGRARSWGGEADVFLWFLDQLADLCVRHAEASIDGVFLYHPSRRQTPMPLMVFLRFIEAWRKRNR